MQEHFAFSFPLLKVLLTTLSIQLCSRICWDFWGWSLWNTTYLFGI